MLVFRLGYEDFDRIARIDTCVVEQKPEVKQIPALHALYDTPQLFSGYLCERIHWNGVRLRQIWPAPQQRDGVHVEDELVVCDIEFQVALSAQWAQWAQWAQIRNASRLFELPVAIGLQLADRALKIILNKPGIGADRLPRA